MERMCRGARRTDRTFERFVVSMQADAENWQGAVLVADSLWACPKDGGAGMILLSRQAVEASCTCDGNHRWRDNTC